MITSAPRLIVITGGAAGIGRATALLCARRGDRVAILDRNAEHAQQTAEAALAEGASGAVGLVCDVTSEDQVAQAFHQAHDRFGPPYGIFANAGIDAGGLVHEMPLARWQNIVDINLTGVFLTCKYGLQQMLAAQSSGSSPSPGSGPSLGSIVCASSPAGFVALAAGGSGAYSATKGAISSLVRCMAIDYAKYGIRVNAIAPGATETGLMWNNVPVEDREAMRRQLCREIPLGRLADPADPARVVAWLLSEEASYMTGTHVVCDGGILAKSSISV